MLGENDEEDDKLKAVKISAAARAILREDGKHPSCDLGPPMHS